MIFDAYFENKNISDRLSTITKQLYTKCQFNTKGLYIRLS